MTDPSTTTSTHCSGVALVASLRRTHQIFIPSTYHALFRHIKSNAQLYDYRHLHHHYLVTCTPKKGSAIPPQKSLFFFSGRDPIPGLATAPDDLHHITSHTHLAMVIIYNLQSRPHVFFFAHSSSCPERHTPNRAHAHHARDPEQVAAGAGVGESAAPCGAHAILTGRERNENNNNKL